MREKREIPDGRAPIGAPPFRPPEVEAERLALGDVLIREAWALSARFPQFDAVRLIELASRVEASNGFALRQFSDPHRKGISSAWIRRAIDRLPELAATIGRRPPL